MANERPDLSVKEVNTPIDNWCCSGHKAPELFKSNGPESLPIPTRFFQITLKSKLLGVFCEPCLIISNYISSKKKEA